MRAISAAARDEEISNFIVSKECNERMNETYQTNDWPVGLEGHRTQSSQRMRSKKRKSKKSENQPRKGNTAQFNVAPGEERRD
jgi:hypothetical protein